MTKQNDMIERLAKLALYFQGVGYDVGEIKEAAAEITRLRERAEMLRAERDQGNCYASEVLEGRQEAIIQAKSRGFAEGLEKAAGIADDSQKAADYDFVSIVGKLTNFIENERLAAWNEGMDEGLGFIRQWMIARGIKPDGNNVPDLLDQIELKFDTDKHKPPRGLTQE